VISRSERDMEVSMPWPGTDVVIGPGVAGRKDSGVYPSSTTDLIKRLRAKDATVEYLVPGPHPELKLMADEFWIPLLMFARDVLVSGTVELVLATIKEQVGALWPRSKMHAQIATYERGATKVRIVTLDGDGEDVLAGMKQVLAGVANDKDKAD
jgi:hypothetical protein